jgi:hypothetical protein
VAEPTLGDVEAASGVRVFIATTSLARRAPLYLDSRAHAGMRVRDALKASAAIPFYFSPVRSPFADNDLLLDGCLTDCEHPHDGEPLTPRGLRLCSGRSKACLGLPPSRAPPHAAPPRAPPTPTPPPPPGTPVGAILGANGASAVDPASVLVLAVHDAAGSGEAGGGGGGGGGGAAAGGASGGVTADLNGLVNGLVATALQVCERGPGGLLRVPHARCAAAGWSGLYACRAAAPASRARPLPPRPRPQAGFHHTLRSGVSVLNLFDAVANVDPLQFRMPAGQARDAVARAQALTEKFAVGLVGADAGAAAAASAARREPASAAAGAGAGASPAQSALHASMGGGGGAGAALADAAGHDLAYGCHCNPWWLSSVDEVHGDFARLV